MPFGMGFGELVLILIIVVVVFGATKLPQLGDGVRSGGGLCRSGRRPFETVGQCRIGPGARSRG